MGKLHLLITLLTLLLFAAPGKAGAASPAMPIDILVNGAYISFDASPFIEEETTFVPARFVSEALGARVDWDAASGVATVTDGETAITLSKGNKYATVNGRRVALHTHIRLVSDRLFLPVRFVSEQMGAIVTWDGAGLVVGIARENASPPPPSMVKELPYSEDDLYWLSRIINAEAEGEPLTGKIAVGEVILNRVKSPDYPNTIHGVIFDRNYGVQFEPILNGRIYEIPSFESIMAAKYCLDSSYGTQTAAGGSLYFLNPSIATNFWIMNNRTLYAVIGSHWFYV